MYAHEIWLLRLHMAPTVQIHRRRLAQTKSSKRMGCARRRHWEGTARREKVIPKIQQIKNQQQPKSPTRCIKGHLNCQTFLKYVSRKLVGCKNID